MSFVADIYYFPGAFHFKLLKEFLKQYKKQFMHLISTKEVLSRWVPTLKREKPFVTVFLPSCQFCGRYTIVSCYISKKTTQRVIKQSKQQFVHLISTKVVLNRWVLTLKREKPFVTVFLPSCQFCVRYAIVSCYISKRTTQRVIKQSKQQFVHLISTKEVLSRWVPNLKREKPFVTVFLPSCQFCDRYAILSCYISKKTTQRVKSSLNSNLCI